MKPLMQLTLARADQYEQTIIRSQIASSNAANQFTRFSFQKIVHASTLSADFALSVQHVPSATATSSQKSLSSCRFRGKRLPEDQLAHLYLPSSQSRLFSMFQAIVRMNRLL